MLRCDAILRRAAVSVAVISILAAGCGSSDRSQTAASTETSESSGGSETIETPYGTTPVNEATAAWRAAITEEFFAPLIEARCGRSLADDLKSIDPNYFECGADLKASDGSVFTQDGSVLCRPKCVAHVGVGIGAYGP